MARTKINITGVMNSTPKGTAVRNVVAGAAGGIASTTYAIDSKIINRNGIGSRLNGVRNLVEEIEDDIEELCATINIGAVRYQSAENRIIGYAQAVRNGSSLHNNSPHMSERHGYSTYFHEVVDTPFVENSSASNIQNDKSDDVLKKNIKNAVKSLLGLLVDEKYVTTRRLWKEGIKFAISKEADGRIYVQIDNYKNLTQAEMAEKLNNYITKSYLDDYDIRRLVNDGLPLYNKNGKLMKDGNKVVGADNVLEEADKLLYISDVFAGCKSFPDKIASAGKVFGKSFGDEIKESAIQFTPEKIAKLTDFSEFSSLSTAGKMDTLLIKGGKTLGVVGDAISLGTNIYENMYNEKTASFDITGMSIVNTATDIVIDVGTSAAAAATGAAIGSLIVPPIGTIVGAVAGMAIDVAINWQVDMDGDGEANSAVDMLKKGTDTVVDWIADKIEDSSDE